MKKTILSIFTLLLIAGSAPAQQGFVHAVGKTIVDTTGAPILLKGLGLGGWLVPEGYMLHTPGFGSPSDIEAKVLDVAGPDAAAAFWQRYRELYVTRADIMQIADWGFNSIRLPMHYKFLYDIESQEFLLDGFTQIDSLVEWCRDAGMYLILDMHCAPGGQSDGNISDSDGTARLWTEPANQDVLVVIWRALAAKYVNEKVIAGYDLINEPVLPDGHTAAELRALYVRLANEIRQIDTNHILYIEGNWWATSFDQLTPPFDSNMSYSFHKYWSATDIGSFYYMIDIRNQYNVPLWMSESGENSNTWFSEMVTNYQATDIGWNWWTHKKFETITSAYSVRITEGWQNLLDYWGGSGTRPNQDTAIEWLMEQVEKIHSDSCDFRPGVVASLTDPNFSTYSRPYKEHVIPGIINAADYDIGTNGQAYLDKVYKNEGEGAYNTGYQYRNDGVDIEVSSDPQGFKYNVGWIETAEYLVYTVTIPYGGIYRAEARIASNGGGGAFRLAMDGNVISDIIDVPNTGGWQNWQTVSIDSIVLPSGTHTMLVFIQSGGFNLNRMEFITITTTDSGDILPLSPVLAPNYPNPFNPGTTIAFDMPNPAPVKLELLDVRGRLLETIWSGNAEAGRTEIAFDGGRYASGIYFYRLTSGATQQTRKMMLIK